MVIKNSKGQSAIEFLMTFTIVLAIVLSFYKIAVNFTNGYLVQYATFMASRSYLVYDRNATMVKDDAPAADRAKQAFDRFSIPKLIPGFNGVPSFNDPEYQGNKTYVGAVTTYSQSFSISNMFGGKNTLTLKSESFLGRGPSRAECGTRVCAAMMQVPGSAAAPCDNNATLFDNGC